MRLSLALLAAALSLLILELLAGYFFPLQVTLFQPDDRLLYKHIPGVRRLHVADKVKGSGWTLLKINSLGFRGRPIEETKKGKRIAVYGDSLVFGEDTDIENSFVERVGVLLTEATGYDVEMINAGVIGYGVDQACLKLEQEIVHLQLDAVVLVICANNDLGEFMRNRIFRLNEEGKLYLTDYKPDSSLIEEFKERREASERFALRRIYDHLKERKHRATFRASLIEQDTPFIETYLQAAWEEYEEFVIRKINTVFSLFFDYYDADVAIFPESASSKIKQALMAAVLVRMKGVCKGVGIPFFVVVVPSALDLCDGFEIRVDRKKFPSYSPSRLTDILSGILKSVNITYVNLYDTFRNNEPENLFIGHGDIHWSMEGQDLAARIVVSHLKNMMQE